MIKPYNTLYLRRIAKYYLYLRHSGHCMSDTRLV